MRCEAEDCPKRNVPANGSDSCTFAGYGWMAKFHVECCPRTYGSETCLGVHAEEAEK